jgi:serine/threonine protein kinase
MPGQSTESHGIDYVKCSHCGSTFSRQLLKCPNCATSVEIDNRIPRTRILKNSEANNPGSGKFTVGMSVSHFTLIRYLGSGGFGEVWKVKSEFGHIMALKIIPLVGNQDAAELIRDYDVTLKIKEYSHIVRYETPELVNMSGTDRYIIIPMELMEGNAGQLKSWFSEMPFAVRERLIIGDLLPQVLEGLEICHQLGIVHLDLKPANILYTEGRSKYKIADFGISIIMDTISQITGTHTQITDGTLQYMPPERIAGRQGDLRSDIYSLGVTICELLFGTPYPEDSPEVSTKLHSFLDGFIEQNPNRRYQSVEEIRNSVSSEQHSQAFRSNSVEESPRESVHADRQKETDQGGGDKERTEKNKPNKKLLIALVSIGILVFFSLVLNGPESLKLLKNAFADIDPSIQELIPEQLETSAPDQSINKSAEVNIHTTEPQPFKPVLSKTDKQKLISVVNDYLQVATWEERLQYVLNPDDVRDEMEENYNGKDLSESHFSDRKRILAEDFGGPATGDDSVQVVMLPLESERRLSIDSIPIYYILRYTRDGWKIDWRNRSVPSSPTRPDLLKVDQPGPDDSPAVIYAFVAFSDYYNYQFRDKKDEYYSLSMEIPYMDTLTSMYGYVPKNSTTGQEIYKILSESDWEAVPLTLKVSYLTKDETDQGFFIQT